MDVSTPPSYEEASAGRRTSIPLIVQLQQYTPGRIIDRHLLSSGKFEKTLADAVLLPTSIPFNDAMTLLHARVLARTGLSALPKDQRFFCRIVLDVNDDRVLLDKGSWKAARDLLKQREDVQLILMFAITPAGYTGVRVREKVGRLLRGLDCNQVCLVELL